MLLSIVATFLSACTCLTKQPMVRRVARLETESRKALEAGDYEALLGVCTELERIAPGNNGVLYSLACAHARLGDDSEAIEALERAAAAGFPAGDHAESDPDLESLRDDPRMADIIAKMKANLEEWQNACHDPYQAAVPEPCPKASSVRAICTHFRWQRRQYWCYGRTLGPWPNYGTDWGYLRGEIDALRAYLDAHPDAKDASRAYLRMINAFPEMHQQSILAEPTLARMRATMDEFRAKYPESDLLPEAEYRLLEGEFMSTIVRLNGAKIDDPEVWNEMRRRLGKRAMELADRATGTKTQGLALFMAAKLHADGELPEMSQIMDRLVPAMKKDREVRRRAWREARVPLLQHLGTPAFRAKDMDGQTRRLEDYRGKLLVLDFWATWCSPCQAELPEMKRLHETYHDQGVEFLGVALEMKRYKSLDEFRQTCEESGVDWPQIYSGKGWKNPVAKQFHIVSVPFLILVDREGKVAGGGRSQNAEVWIRDELGLPPLEEKQEADE